MDDISNDEPHEPLPAAHLTTEKLVTVARFPTVSNANLAVALLEEAGIPARVDGAAIVQNDWALALATGWVRICVLSANVDEAREILRQAFSRSVGESDTLCPKCGQPMPAGWEICWNCADNTLDIETPLAPSQSKQEVSKFPWSAVATLALLGVYVQFGVFAFVSSLVGSLLVFYWWQRTEGEPIARESHDIDRPVITRQSFSTQNNDATAGLLAEDKEPDTDEELAEELRARAFRSAVFGFIIPPLWLYAIWLLLRLTTLPPSSQAGWPMWRGIITWILALFGTMFIACFFIASYFTSYRGY